MKKMVVLILLILVRFLKLSGKEEKTKEKNEWPIINHFSREWVMGLPIKLISFPW